MRFTEHATEAEALIERRHFQFLGLRLAWSIYRRPIYSASGAPVGIVRSFWIYTRRRAWGWGTVVDWAKLQNLEVKIGPLAPIITEHGRIWIVPPLAIGMRKDGGQLDIRIHNRNPVDAVVTLMLFDSEPGGGYQPDPQPPQAGVQYHTAVLRNSQKSFSIAIERAHVFTHAIVETEPGTAERRARIYGRPEWGG